MSCRDYQQKFSDLSKIRKNRDLNPVFENIHYQINNSIYRTRSFFKDGNNGLTKIFLTYIEDEEENAKIIERRENTPGPLFLSFKNNKDSRVIFHEKAFFDSKINLFLHFINNKIVNLQGKSFDCTF